MNNNDFSMNSLIKLQTMSWYLVLGYFAVAVLVYALGIVLPFEFGMYGVLLVISVTVLKIIVLAEKFRKMKLIRYVLLSYTLILILSITIIIRLIR